MSLVPLADAFNHKAAVVRLSADYAVQGASSDTDDTESGDGGGDGDGDGGEAGSRASDSAGGNGAQAAHESVTRHSASPVLRQTARLHGHGACQVLRRVRAALKMNLLGYCDRIGGIPGRPGR